ncbi:hypothetical protein PVL29_010760 [Vitis rotundifolia]|uniref:Uncharacterized protein n=1 Tax=Vitis rotundifolia TaxID=103349 RepID=A0AA38ZUA7_VITRO|nr:hypothetical protein PVL29_010760 [Vitis rotundifolia]
MRFEIIVKDNTSSSMEERFKSVMGPEDRKTSQLGETKWPMIPKVSQLLRGTKDFTKQFEPRVGSVGPYHHHKPELKPAEMMKRQMTKRFILDSGQCIEVLYNKITFYNRTCSCWRINFPFGFWSCCWNQDSKRIHGCKRLRFMCLTINGWEAEPSEVTYSPKEEKGPHLLDLLRRRLQGNARVPKRVARKLKAAGISIKPNKSSSLRDISFKSYGFYGVLKLPQITIDDSTTSRFLNLIAYEMCSEVPSEVT